MARDDWWRRGQRPVLRVLRNTDPYAADSGEDAGPVDIAAVHRDDALLDAIAGGGPVSTTDAEGAWGVGELSAEDEALATLLADWRAEMVAEPAVALPTLDTVVAALDDEVAARRMRHRMRTGNRLRLVRPLAGTAAAVALVIGGMTAFSYAAEPGDPLWRVKEVVFSEQAQTTVAQRADADLTTAQTSLQQGDTQGASARLQSASSSTNEVQDQDKKQSLVQRWQQVYTDLRQRAPEVAQRLGQVAPGLLPQDVTNGTDAGKSRVTERHATPTSTTTTAVPAPASPAVPVPQLPGGLPLPSGLPQIPGIPQILPPAPNSPAPVPPKSPANGAVSSAPAPPPIPVLPGLPRLPGT